MTTEEISKLARSGSLPQEITAHLSGTLSVFHPGESVRRVQAEKNHSGTGRKREKSCNYAVPEGHCRLLMAQEYDSALLAVVAEHRACRLGLQKRA